LTVDCRFPRQSRLLMAREFHRVFERAQRSSDPLFTVLARTNEGGAARLGLAVSRKAINRAIDRNRVKRLVRQSFRHQKTRLQGLDLVVMARSQVVGTENAKLEASLERHWTRLLARCARC
jgi:ribonuclease P protein component